MKIENKTNISKMPMEVALKKLPQIVIKLLNGAEITMNYANKHDVVRIFFDNNEEFINVADFINCKTVADYIWQIYIQANKLETSYSSLSHILKIYELAYNKIKDIYGQRENNKIKLLAIKGDDSGCGYWRMVLPTRYLNEEQFMVDVSTVEVIYEYLIEYDIIFIQRVCSWNSIYVLEKLKRMGKKLIYDIDDNIFDIPEHNPSKNYYGNDEREASIAIMQLVDKIVVTTDYLKKTLIEYIDNIEDKIEVIPNAIDISNFPVRQLYPERAKNNNEIFRILWAGSATHEYDFYSCLDDIDMFMKQHINDEVRFLFMGYLPLCVRNLLEQPHWKNKVEFMEFRDIETYFSLLRRVQADIAIAPLLDGKFNRCKSNIKWQEYTIADIPVIASAVEPYLQTIEDGKDGFLVDTFSSGGWLEILNKKFDNRDLDLWKSIVANARQKIISDYNIEKIRYKWQSLFETICKNFNN